VLITPTGAVNMTAGAPAGLDEIYALIRQSALKIDRSSLRSRRISVFSALKGN